MQANSPETSQLQSKTTSKWPRRVLWTAGTLLVLWALAWGLGWALLPIILKSQGEKYGSEALGRKVTLGNVDFKPWTLELTLRDVAVQKPDGSQQLQIKRIYVDAALQSLVERAPVIDAVAVEGVNLKLAHLGDGKYDIDDVIARLNKPSAKPASPASEPLKFALFNLALTDAAVDFSDATVSRTHLLRDLNLSVPFLSNLDARRDVFTEPKLAFKLNGSAFGSTAQTTPFAQTRKTDASLQVTGFDLKPYLGYVPASLPVRLKTAVLNADIKVAFEQLARPAVKLSGVLDVTGVKLTDARTQELLEFEGLNVQLADVRPLEQVVKIASVALTAPRLAVTRDKAGLINLLGLNPAGGDVKNSAISEGTVAPATSRASRAPVAPPGSKTAQAPAELASSAPAVSPSQSSSTTETIANYSSRTSANAIIDSKTPVWKVEIAKFAVQDGRVTWRDATTVPTAALALQGVALQASAIALPFAQPLAFSGAAELAALGQDQKTALASGASARVAPSEPTRPAVAAPASPNPSATAKVTFSGTATDQAANVNASLRDLPLALASPYLAQFIEPTLGGSLATELAVNWTPSTLKLGVKLLTLSELALRAGSPVGNAVKGSGKASEKATATSAAKKSLPALAAIKKLEIADAQIDLGPQKVTVGRITIDQPTASVERDKDKRWMFERWVKVIQPVIQPVSQSVSQRSSSAMPKSPPSPAKQLAQRPPQPSAAVAAPKAKTPDAASPKPWTVLVADLSLNGGAISFVDRASVKPVAFELAALKAQAKGFSVDAKQPFPLAVSGRIRATQQTNQGEFGQFDYRGNLGLLPLAAQGKVVATQIPVHAFEPYFGDALNIELLRADVGFKGDVRYLSGAAAGAAGSADIGSAKGATLARGPSIKVTGDAVVEDFRANSALPQLTGQTELTGQGGEASAPAVAASAPAVAASAPAVASPLKAPSGPVKSAVAGDLKISEELLSWKALSLRGVDVAISPGSVTTVSVSETALSDFFARVLINETGRINLQDVVKSAAAPVGLNPATPETAATSVKNQNATINIANNVSRTWANGINDAPVPLPAASAPNLAGGPASGSSAASTRGSTAAPASLTVPSSPASAANPADPVINIGPINLVNGKVYFSDRFVRPNYSANLSELTGKLTAFSSVAPAGGPQMADLELRGRAEGTASLEILGKLNPLAKPLALDIKGKVRDLELAPLSPYSVKYAGHGIERGKLSVDVGYVVLPDGQLTATNNIILNQLTFGDKVEGAPASLPVRLAVALLADRNGVIDINLPVSGSLNDPQFRLGPIIFKVIVNLIVKAITSPFSLLASAFGGGGDELSMVSFAPGTAALGPDARAGLDKVAKALSDRPGLKLTVVGSANLEAEREAYKRERLTALLQAEKRRAAVVSGGASALASAAGAGSATTASVPAPLAIAVALTEAETPALLKEVYRRADMAKPRNLVGIAKDLPPGEMEALLLANIAVSEDAMRELALQRGVAVKEYLADKQLPPERLFLGAAKPGAVDAKWTPHAELSLLTK